MNAFVHRVLQPDLQFQLLLIGLLLQGQSYRACLNTLAVTINVSDKEIANIFHHVLHTKYKSIEPSTKVGKVSRKEMDQFIQIMNVADHVAIDQVQLKRQQEQLWIKLERWNNAKLQRLLQ